MAYVTGEFLVLNYSIRFNKQAFGVLLYHIFMLVFHYILGPTFAVIVLDWFYLYLKSKFTFFNKMSSVAFYDYWRV